MIAQIKPKLDYESQINVFISALLEIADLYLWVEESESLRAYDSEGNRYCPLSAIVNSLYYQDVGVDAYSAGRFLGMSSSVVSSIVGAVDGDWTSTDTELRHKIMSAVSLKCVDE